MYTASPSPSNVVSAMTALRQIRERPDLRQSLWNNARALHEGLIQLGFKPLAEPSPIAAIGLADDAMAVAMWNRLLDNGVYVNLALPPGTPNGVPLLRCSVSAAHRPDQIARVCDAFERSMAEVQAEMGAMMPSVAASSAG